MVASLPTQGQLLLPLLAVLKDEGAVPARVACSLVAERLGVSREVREATQQMADGQSVNLFDRRVRWTRQNAVIADLISAEKRGIWNLTQTGDKTDSLAKPGVVITVYSSPSGSMLWAEAASALQYVEDCSVTSVITSPPYPLVKPREYDKGHPEWSSERYLDTLISHIEMIRPKLTADGTFVLNLGQAFLEGRPCRNPYQHRLLTALIDRLGWNLVDEHLWVSPTRPRTSPHVTKTKTHCANLIEQVYLLSPTGRTKCCTLRVLNPYTPRHQKLINSGGEIVARCSPSAIKTPGIRNGGDNGGAIPGNVHTLPPDRDLQYRRFCKERGIAEHPAMMPLKLAEFFVGLTSEPGDVIMDPFGGSGKVGVAALNLDRRFIIAERRLDYLLGATSRVPHDADAMRPESFVHASSLI